MKIYNIKKNIFNTINFILKKLYNDRKIISVSVLLGFIFTIVFGAVTYVYSKEVQSGIAQSIIRFHVLANSNSEDDQNLKFIVRDEVLKEYGSRLDNFENIEQTEAYLKEHYSEIKAFSENVIKENGYNYSVAVQLSEETFPTKVYGDMAFPAGKYRAFRIIIGEGKGNNWWCVMFPPLCFVDVTHSSVSEKSKEKFKTILSDEEYGIVADNEPVFKVKFKIVEWWNSL